MCDKTAKESAREFFFESTASYAWQKQETLKGSRFIAGTAHGGWGFHTWRVAGFDYRYTAAEAAAMVADGSVPNSPVFNRGYAPMLGPAATDDEVACALAKYVPAVSGPLGGKHNSQLDNTTRETGETLNGFRFYCASAGRSADLPK